MKSHELAKALSQLAKILRSGPNIEIDEIKLGESLIKQRELRLSSKSYKTRKTQKDLKGIEIAANLLTHSSLSRISKSEWKFFIEQFEINIPVRPRDSALDILRNLLSFLDKNKESRRNLKRRLESTEIKASPELMRAFSTLLRED